MKALQSTNCRLAVTFTTQQINSQKLKSQSLYFFHLLVGLLLCCLFFCNCSFKIKKSNTSSDRKAIIKWIMKSLDQYSMGLGLHLQLSLTSSEITISWIQRKETSNLRTSEILLFYNLQLFYWHFLEILWLFIFLFLFLHLGRAISYGSYFYNPNNWFSGIVLFFFLMATI